MMFIMIYYDTLSEAEIRWVFDDNKWIILLISS